MGKRAKKRKGSEAEITLQPARRMDGQWPSVDGGDDVDEQRDRQPCALVHWSLASCERRRGRCNGHDSCSEAFQSKKGPEMKWDRMAGREGEGDCQRTRPLHADNVLSGFWDSCEPVHPNLAG